VGKEKEVMGIRIVSSRRQEGGMQPAKSGDAVKVHYTGKLEDGTVFDSSSGKEATEFNDRFPQALETSVSPSHFIEPRDSSGGTPPLVTVFRELAVHVEEKEVLDFLGFKPVENHRRIRDLVKLGLEVFDRLPAPKAVTYTTDLSIENGLPVLGAAHVLHSRMLGKVLTPCTRAVVFATTLGREMDEAIETAQRQAAPFGYVLDAIASLRAGKAAECLEKAIEETLAPGEGMTLRYSPGYCDWPLFGQKALFDLLGGREIGLTLNGHCMMTPRKSISGILGIGPRSETARTGNACLMCGRSECEHRRI